MAFLTKLSVTRWTDPHTGQRVPAGTLGATKTTEKTQTYFIVDKSDGRTTRINTGRTDHRAAQATLTKYHRDRERGEVGLTDPRKKYKDRPLREWIGDYLSDLQTRTDPTHYHEVERVLNLVADHTGATTLRQLTPDTIRTYLSSLSCSASTRNKHRTYLQTFFNFLVGESKPYEANPVTKQSVPRYKQTAPQGRKRGLTPKELARLVDAAERYSTTVVAVNKGGRPRKDGTRPAPSPVQLSPKTLSALTERGRERQLMYRTAILTGFRRAELARLKVRNLYLNDRPRIDTAATKNRRRVVVPLVGTLAEALRAWIRETRKKPDDLVFSVPDKSNLVKVHRANLTLAGIPYRDENGRVSGFHCLRRSVNMILKRASVSYEARRRFLRHAAGDVTTKHYDDDEGRPTMNQTVFRLLTKLDRRLASPVPVV